MPSPKKPKAISKPTSKHVVPRSAAAPFLSDDPAAAFAHFKPEAQTVAKADAKRLTVDPDILLNNVRIAVATFETIQADVAAAVPGAPIHQFLEIPTLALAVLYASDQVIDQASSGEIATRLAAAGVLRTPMLAMLEVLASPPVGLADPQRVKAIRAGTGPLDRAHDAINIAAYFAELGDAVAHKHPFTAGQFAQLSEHGRWLVQQLAPSGAVPGPSASDPAAVIRDQLWTLLVARYDALRAAASVVLGFQNLDQRLPPLGTRIATRKATAPAAPPPAASPVADTTSRS